MNIGRAERWWLVTIDQTERAEIYAEEKHPSERAIAAVARREGVGVDELHSSEVRVRDGRVEVVVRRRDQQLRYGLNSQ
ncbi:hypothetical protein [Halococcus hamelinensis]|uniref:Uncharacterized protein n=1 Tax=Halococcus hamelinensis 100A6 TaxID=1132509 RepID=M0M1M5_9EURY|nr:hypothetical protein [Halococcus hamelinensis]EMA38484.1 hypothetical protein C447_10027 [Halococcus hamelinensis 100A6]